MQQLRPERVDERLRTLRPSGHVPRPAAVPPSRRARRLPPRRFHRQRLIEVAQITPAAVLRDSVSSGRRSAVAIVRSAGAVRTAVDDACTIRRASEGGSSAPSATTPFSSSRLPHARSVSGAAPRRSVAITAFAAAARIPGDPRRSEWFQPGRRDEHQPPHRCAACCDAASAPHPCRVNDRQDRTARGFPAPPTRARS